MSVLWGADRGGIIQCVSTEGDRSKKPTHPLTNTDMAWQWALSRFLESLLGICFWGEELEGAVERIGEG